MVGSKSWDENHLVESTRLQAREAYLVITWLVVTQIENFDRGNSTWLEIRLFGCQIYMVPLPFASLHMVPSSLSFISPISEREDGLKSWFWVLIMISYNHPIKREKNHHHLLYIITINLVRYGFHGGSITFQWNIYCLLKKKYYFFLFFWSREVIN